MTTIYRNTYNVEPVGFELDIQTDRGVGVEYYQTQGRLVLKSSKIEQLMFVFGLLQANNPEAKFTKIFK